MSGTLRLAVVLGFLTGLWSCTTGSNDPDTGLKPTDQAELLFKSGFEGQVRLGAQIDDMVPIVGLDTETGDSWPIEILGASGSGLHYIEDDNHRAVGSELRSVIGPYGNRTRVLYSYENREYGESTQNPYEILDIKEGRKDLYIKYWIKLDSSGMSAPDKWRTFFEWKTKDYEKGIGFRLISFVYTDAQGVPYWHWQGDRDSEHPVWEIDNKQIPVPLDEWFLTEFYWHWSEGSDGRALWKVNGEVIGDHRGPTTRNSKPIDFIMLTQIYGDSNPKKQWIDDIEIWDGLPE
ncbi:MAG TPA: hypothetical protein ENK01_01070 [Hellea balneolensis]|uniref:LamG domain-containing protein n=1 Tax=Hellea balneolensis TaxID=287478 RepID=A0A7V5NWF0_9PROT|nr:hypothetical protein [Hellea balneolensis]